MSNLDTLYTISLNHGFPNEIIETIRVIVIFLAGYLLNHFYQRYQEKNRIKKTKKYLIFCINILENSTRGQVDLINKFCKQFQQKKFVILPLEMNGDFHLDNISAISKTDIFEILVQKNPSKNEEDKSNLFSSYNYSIRAIEKAYKEMEPFMKLYTDLTNKTKSDWQLNKDILEKKIRELKLSSREHKISENEKAFLNEVNKLQGNFNIENNEDIIFQKMEKIYFPLKDLIISCEVISLVEPLELIVGAYDQLIHYNEFYYELFSSFSEELNQSVNLLNKIKKGI